jgi:hypothetical protein
MPVGDSAFKGTVKIVRYSQEVIRELFESRRK